MDKAKEIASYILAGSIIFASGCGETPNKVDSTKEVKSNTKVTKVETETLTPAIFKKQISQLCWHSVCSSCLLHHAVSTP